jgi:hypothetical protein
MKFPTAEYPFVFLTACFSGTWEGKNPQASELRIPALRGHLRLWHRALYPVAGANRVWGNAAGKEGSGSRVGIMLKNLPPASNAKADTLPHKDEVFKRGPRAALPAGTKAIFVLQRLPGCTATDWEQAQKAAKLWLLLGSLGNRSNRAAGSAWPDETNTLAPAPSSPDDLRRQLAALGCNWALALAPTSIGNTWESLRKAASDTPAVPASYGSANPRTPSPTHFKVVRFGTQLRLLVFAKEASGLASAKITMEQKRLSALSKPKEWVSI